MFNVFVGKQLKNSAKRLKITNPEFHRKLMNAMRNQNRDNRHHLTKEKKALHKANQEAKATEKAAANATREVEAQAYTTELQFQLDAMAKEAGNANGTPTAGGMIRN